MGELFKKIGWCWRRGKKIYNYVSLCAYTYTLCVCTYTLLCLSRSQPTQNWKSKRAPTRDKIYLLPWDRIEPINHFLNWFTLPKTRFSVHICVCISLQTHEFLILVCLRKPAGVISEATRPRWTSSTVPCLPPRAGRLQAAACTPKPRKPEMLSASFHLHAILSSGWGDAVGVSPCSRGVCCRTAVPQHTGWASPSVAGGEGLHQGPGEVLQSFSSHRDMATSLNASWSLSSQPWPLLLPRAISAVALLPRSTSYPKITPAPPSASSALCRGLPASSVGGTFMWSHGNWSGFKHKRWITWFAFFPIWGSLARGGQSWNPKPLCAYLLYDPVGCSVYSNPASIWIR